MSGPTFVFMGRPGSGKGTQAKVLAEQCGYAYFSTGDRFRELAKEESALGDLVRTTIDQGKLMPHWFASYIVQDFILHTPREQGIVLDGSNRTLPEAQLFDEYMRWLGRTYRVLYLEVPENIIVTRILGRAARGSGRADDTEVSIKKRIEEYDTHTLAALTFLEKQGVVTRLDGNRGIPAITLDITEIVAGLK